VSGKGKKRKLSEQEHAHLHMYILTNCDDIREYERYIVHNIIYVFIIIFIFYQINDFFFMIGFTRV